MQQLCATAGLQQDEAWATQTAGSPAVASALADASACSRRLRAAAGAAASNITSSTQAAHMAAAESSEGRIGAGRQGGTAAVAGLAASGTLKTKVGVNK